MHHPAHPGFASIFQQGARSFDGDGIHAPRVVIAPQQRRGMEDDFNVLHGR